MLATLFSETPLVTEIDTIFKCLKSFPKRTSCRRYGLPALHVLDLLCGESSIVARYFLYSITLILNLWLGGICLMSLVEFVASSPLILLLNPNSGILLISVGYIWRWLVSKVGMRGFSEDVTHYFNDFHFGVGLSGGAKAIFHSANKVLSKQYEDVSLVMLTVYSCMILTWYIDQNYCAR